jgi:hypothetical protein
VYADAFWKRVDDLSEKERIIKAVERGENVIE